jgi:hypothetical protein
MWRNKWKCATKIAFKELLQLVDVLELLQLMLLSPRYLCQIRLQSEQMDFSLMRADKNGQVFLSCLTSLKALAREPTSCVMRFTSSSKTSQRRLAKISGRINSLYFAASFAPRMEHAASQIQIPAICRYFRGEFCWQTTAGDFELQPAAALSTAATFGSMAS